MVKRQAIPIILGCFQTFCAYKGIRQIIRFVTTHNNEYSYNEILPGLYLGNERAARSNSLMQDLQISHILTIMSENIPPVEDENIKLLFIRAFDSPDTNLLSVFPIANNFIAEGIAEGNVFVHCRFGVSRSAALVIAFLMEHHNLSFDEAFKFVRSRRKIINPNSGFIRQLKAFRPPPNHGGYEHSKCPHAWCLGLGAGTIVIVLGVVILLVFLLF